MTTPPDNEETPKRGRGRPRRHGADGEILAVAMAMLREQGYRDLTVDAVAAQAGVAKTTVYRRWPSKGALIAAAIAPATASMPPAPHSGSVEVDLASVLLDIVAFLRLAGDARSDPEMSAAIEAALTPHRARLAAVLGRVPFPAGRGLDLDLIVDLLVAPLLLGRHDVESIVMIVMHGANGS